jgi:hypothetical protein
MHALSEVPVISLKLRAAHSQRNENSLLVAANDEAADVGCTYGTENGASWPCCILTGNYRRECNARNDKTGSSCCMQP